MNDKMCSLRQAEMAMIFALKEADLLDLAKEQEEIFTTQPLSSSLTHMLQTETERTANYFIETNLVFSKYNENRLLFQENIFLDCDDNFSDDANLTCINYKETNKVALIQNAMSRMALKYMQQQDESFNLLPVLVYLGNDLPPYFSHNRSYQSKQEDSPFSRFELSTNKSFLFLDVKTVDWQEIIKLSLEKVPEADRLLLCSKIIFASYYQILLSLYNKEIDKIYYPLHKMQECIIFLLKKDKELYYPYANGILASLSDKLSLFQSSDRITSNERYEVDKKLAEFLSVTNL